MGITVSRFRSTMTRKRENYEELRSEDWRLSKKMADP